MAAKKKKAPAAAKKPALKKPAAKPATSRTAPHAGAARTPPPARKPAATKMAMTENVASTPAPPTPAPPTPSPPTPSPPTPPPPPPAAQVEPAAAPMQTTAAPKGATEPTFADKADKADRPAMPARVVWHDLMSIDVDRARPFYAAILPWRTRVVSQPPLGTTHRIELGGRELGSLVSLPTSEGIASHWMPYAQVDDLDAVVRRARELGGFVPVAPTLLEGLGRFAVIADPRGAHISPFEPARPTQGASALQPGLPAWNEVLSDEPENTARFFAAVFGWGMRSQDLGALGPATLFVAGDDTVAGCRRAPEGAVPQWVVAWTVTQVDQSVAKARQHGAQVLMPPTEVPGVGRVALLKDPTGAHVSLFQALAG